jgi:hypothetical protein
VDGFATPYLVHTVRGVEDRGPTGSVAMINSDVLEDVTLSNGGYAQRYGGHTGAEVDFRLREGSRERRIFHVAVSGTNASAVAEGPIGTRRRGAWLISARQSYLDLIVHHLTSHSISFDFADAQARVAYDLTSRQRIDVTALAGHSRFQNEPGQTDIADMYSDRASFATKFRLGSNFPVPGYYAERDGAFSVSDVRNTARLPTYARLDRANRTFTWSGRRLTLFAEVINALNRANVRFTPPFVNRTTRATTTPFASLLPIIPSVGILIEF